MIVHFGPEALPRLAEVSVDTSALAVALGLGLVTALVFGFAPAVAWSATVPNSALKEGSNSVIRGDRVGGVIVGIQLALALVLLTGAGLMVKSAWRMNAHPEGFDPARILTMKLRFVGTDYAESPTRQSGFIRELTAKLNALPGVAGASISTHGELLAPRLMVEGQAESSRSRSTTEPPILINATSAALPRVMGLRLARGRWFADHEANAVINEAAERRAFHGVDAVGQRISLAGLSHPVTVVGVVANLKYAKLDAAPEPESTLRYRGGCDRGTNRHPPHVGFALRRHADRPAHFRGCGGGPGHNGPARLLRAGSPGVARGSVVTAAARVRAVLNSDGAAGIRCHGS